MDPKYREKKKSYVTTNNMTIKSDTSLHNSFSVSQVTPRQKVDELSINKIFVGGLSWDTTQERLYEYFSKFGTIVDCILMIDGTSGRSRGFGFVTFLHYDSVITVLTTTQHILDNKIIDPKAAVPKYIKDVENKCQQLNESVQSNNLNAFVSSSKNSKHHQSNEQAQLASLQCFPSQSIPSNYLSSSQFLCPTLIYNTKIFVGGIGHASENDLREYFSTFGSVTDVTIMMDKATGRPRGFAFIGYSTIESAELTASIRYHSIRNKQVEVKKALPKDAKSFSNSSHILNNFSENQSSLKSNHPVETNNSIANSFHTDQNSYIDPSITHSFCNVSNSASHGNDKNGLDTMNVLANNDRSTNILQTSVFGGEWDFDEVIHSNNPKANIEQQNTFLSNNTNNEQHNNLLFGFSQQSLNVSNNSLHLNDNFLLQNQNQNPNQKMRFSSLQETSYISQDLPDDTKNSIVQLLNEIWK